MRQPVSRSAIALPLAAWVTVFTPLLWADPPGGPILHEFFELERGHPTPAPSPDPGEGARSPGAVEHRPEGPVTPLGDDPSAPGARNAPDRGIGDMVLDRDTDMEGWLNYFAVFDPTVAPLKRVGVRDLVVVEDGEVRLSVSDERVESVRLQTASPLVGVERFRGSIVVNAEAGSLIPIPSVGPRMGIHAYDTEPETRVRFLRDGASNYYARLADGGVVHLTYDVSTPVAYFGALLSQSMGRLTDIGEELRHPVPFQVLGPAQVLFEQLDLRDNMPVRSWVAALTGYLRDFRAEPFPDASRTEDIYRDILFGGVGVCRHRAFAFVVTLQAWGVPARYIYNEAHAFAEAYIPEHGWLRVDLGGGALGLNLFDAGDRVLHAPVAGDALPLPARFRESYSQQVAQETAGEGGQRVQGGTGEAAAAEGTSAWYAFGDPHLELSDLPPAPGEGRPSADPPAGPSHVDFRSATTLTLAAVEATAFRGEALHLEGRIVSDADDPVSGREVSVYLGPTSEQGDGRVIEIGQLISDDGGQLRGTVMLPGSLRVGEWGIYLVFPGDTTYAASRSR